MVHRAHNSGMKQMSERARLGAMAREYIVCLNNEQEFTAPGVDPQNRTQKPTHSGGDVRSADD